ncbi:FecR family protein [Aliarcobacter cryaerophilus]|jgi:transmembrane sensor|uniref:FecR family protein n=1 Tax=Aliarcobacter cryaerophilus TaxID=28198 RepID=UPI0021B689D6|nr:FecR domain-containing protein [Aliarcobacter cryaerophilus]MCT7493253.1 FecR domain-containing protein [Aliarcobacter cryaerophilus]
MKESIEEKAAYFFTCKKDGFTKTQELEFQIWIKENIEHKKAFEKVEMLQSLYLSLPSDIKSKISQEVHRNIKSRNSLRKSNFLKFAASVIFIIGASLFGINEYMNFGIKHTYTSNQEIKNIVLPDGSKVILDAKTKLDIKYFSDKREINIIEGKALFDVTSNPNKPFIVNANMIKVEVLGTNFEVKNEIDKIVVDVINGKVKVEQNKNNEFQQLAILTKGKHISFDKQSKKVILKDIDINNIASWKDGILFFQDYSLEKAINEFKKYQDINITIQKDIKNYTVSGSFSIHEIDKFIFALTKIYPIKVDNKVDSTYIYKKF